jgi:hypothetical protein
VPLSLLVDNENQLHDTGGHRARRIALACAVVLSVAGRAAAEERKAAAPPGADTAELSRKVEILTEEVEKLRERLVIPEKEAFKSVYGLGPAASKVYLQKSGLSVGGYGEFYVDRLVKDKQPGVDYNTGDMLRYVQYIGYKFTDWLVMNAEVEVEHAGPSDPNFQGEKGEVAVEFAYLDFLLHRAANLRLGLLLVPMGFLNEIHEPPFYHGTLRPAVEQVIIPTTWSELGAGLFGEPLPGLTYKLYTVAGLNAQNFSPQGWREGRQNGSQILAEQFGVVVRVDYKSGDLFTVGGSFFCSGADQNHVPGVRASTFLGEGHLQVRFHGLELRGLLAYGALSGARELTLALYPDRTDPANPEQALLASEIYGWYLEAAYDLWPLFSPKNIYLAPYFRFERYSTQYKTPAVAGRTPDASLDTTVVEAGLTFKPHPQVVVKLNYRDVSNGAGTPVADGLFVGAGFIY